MEPIQSKENKGIDLKPSSIIIAVISAIAGLLGSGIAAVIQGFNQASLEQQKFESNLILKALEPKSQNERAKYLRFLVNTGLVKNLNQDGIKEVANDESSIPRSIPQTPFQSSDSRTAKSYNILEKFLTNKDWKNANISTMEILIDRANSSRSDRDPNQDWLEPVDIESLSCYDLRNIDNLWSRASNKRFGFAAQSEIWQSVGGTIKTQPDKPEIRKNFSNKIGWIGADSGRFDLNKLHSKTNVGTDFKNLPKGYLPSSIGKYTGLQIWVGNFNEFATLASKLKQCNISPN